MRRDTPITWEELVEREPRLAELLADVLTVKDGGGPYFCANEAWYSRPAENPRPQRLGGYGFKSRMVDLVGWDAETDDPALRTQAAYSVAYQKLYAPLPPCRNCICL